MGLAGGLRGIEAFADGVAQDFKASPRTFDDESILLCLKDCADDAVGAEDCFAGPEFTNHLKAFLFLLLLRANHQEIEGRKHNDDGQEGRELGCGCRGGGLGEEGCHKV